MDVPQVSELHQKPHDWSRFKYGSELRNNSGTVRMSSQFYRSDEQEDLMVGMPDRGVL